MGKIEPKIDPELLAQAQEAGVPVDQVIEDALRRALLKADKAGADARAAKWAEDNAEAIKDYNRRIRQRGVFSAGFRTW
ncbi:MAG: post-segregation antitoxin CcdA [Phenylobacterium sp.]|nr:post-segregation antitoxin CcdA [Phenylobacterium sp.]